MIMDSNALDSSMLQKFRSQYSHYNDLRSSFGSQLLTSSAFESRSSQASGKPTYVLNLHFMGLAGLPKAGWLERTPHYELIVHAGGVAKRIRPRIPAPPPGVGAETIELEEFVPPEQLKVLQRLDDRASIRCPAPGEFFRVDVWEERAPLLDFGNKGSTRSMLGQCYVPLEQKYNRRPCTWPIVSRNDRVMAEIGFLTCKFGLATMPGQVQNLRIVEGTVGSTEMQLAWEPPENDGGTMLRGYRVEARASSSRDLADPLAGIAPIGDETPRTASAPAVPEPSAVLRNLTGNTEYVFCVWAVSEAGPGAGSEMYGKTGAVAPGLCGLPQLAGSSEAYFISFFPPEDTGGADIIAYRVWLRALFQDSHGEIWPAEGWVDLGLSEHQGGSSDTQYVPLRIEALPPCAGCLCSISALNTAGLVGPSTPEAPLVAPEQAQTQDASIPRPPEHTIDGERGTSAFAAEASPVPPRSASPVPPRSPEPPSPEMIGDPLAQYHPPGALARHQTRGISGESDSALAAQLHSAAIASSASLRRRTSPPRQAHPSSASFSYQAQPAVNGGGLAAASTSPQARRLADGAASSGSSPESRSSPGANSGSRGSPGSAAVATSKPQIKPEAPLGVTRTVVERHNLEAPIGVTRTIVEAGGRVVDPSEIRKARSSSVEPRYIARAVPPQRAGLHDGNSGSTSVVAASGVEVPLQQHKAGIGASEAGAAGSWGRGQKGSLNAISASNHIKAESQSF
jgi:hypothetical protein